MHVSPAKINYTEVANMEVVVNTIEAVDVNQRSVANIQHSDKNKAILSDSTILC